MLQPDLDLTSLSTLLALFQEASEEDVVRLMSRLLAARPDVETSLLTAIHTAQLALRLEATSSWPSGLPAVWEELPGEGPELPRLRFATSNYFVGEEEEKVQIEAGARGEPV